MAEWNCQCVGGQILCCYNANVNCCHGRSEEEKHKWEKRTQFFWYSLSYLSVNLSNHVCSSCSSTFRAKIHWNVLVLSAVYRKLLNYKMVNKIYFKDQCAAVFFCLFVVFFNCHITSYHSKCIILNICLGYFTFTSWLLSFLVQLSMFWVVSIKKGIQDVIVSTKAVFDFFLLNTNTVDILCLYMHVRMENDYIKEKIILCKVYKYSVWHLYYQNCPIILYYLPVILTLWVCAT